MRALRALLLRKWSLSRGLGSAMPPLFANMSAVVLFMRGGSGFTLMVSCWSNGRGSGRHSITTHSLCRRSANTPGTSIPIWIFPHP